MQEAHRFNAAATNRTGECRNTGCASFVSTSYVPAFFEIAQALIPDFLPGRRFRLYSRLSCADCCDNAACHYYSSYYDSIARYELQNMYHYEAGLLLVHWRSPNVAVPVECGFQGMRMPALPVRRRLFASGGSGCCEFPVNAFLRCFCLALPHLETATGARNIMR